MVLLDNAAVVDIQVDKEDTFHSSLVEGKAHVSIEEDLLADTDALDACHTDSVPHLVEETWLNNQHRVLEIYCLLLQKIVVLVLQKHLDLQESCLPLRAPVWAPHVHLTILHHYSSDIQ